MADKNKDDKKLMDVSRPGKSAPSATSRPIIVTHGPIMQDPMVNDTAKAVDSIPESDEPVSSESAVVDAAQAGASKTGDTASARHNRNSIVLLILILVLAIGYAVIVVW